MRHRQYPPVTDVCKSDVSIALVMDNSSYPVYVTFYDKLHWQRGRCQLFSRYAHLPAFGKFLLSSPSYVACVA